MRKTFYLYLDESGDFDRDLNIRWKNECLVGGFLQEESRQMDGFAAEEILITAAKKVFPELADQPRREILDHVHHATELSEKVAELDAEILTDLEKKADFVIFENFEKQKVIDSSRTYLNILVDGLIQLLSKLVIANPDDSVILNVTAGFRRDMVYIEAHPGEIEWIAQEQYTNRIRERLELERLKHQNIYRSGSRIEFQRGNDHRNPLLILCDYICNFYMTRSRQAFSAEYKDGVSYKDYLLTKYHDKNKFQLSGNGEDDRVLNYMNSEAYDSALYDICTGLISQEENIRVILERIGSLQDRELENVLLSLSNYLNSLVGVDRNITSSLDYLKKAEDIASSLKGNGKDVSQFLFDVKLYELAVYDHRGELAKMEEIFSECREPLKELIVQTENIRYAYMFYNRFAVYLYDTFEFDKGYHLLDRLKDNFIAYEMILTDLPGLDVSEEDIKTEQLGKMLGTMSMYCAQKIRAGEMSLADAREVNDRSLHNFRLESDRKRQYQNRCDIESEGGAFEESIRYLCLSKDALNWEELFKTENSDAFTMYHLSRIAKKFSADENCQDAVKAMIRRFRNQERSLFSRQGFPVFLTAANVAAAMGNLSMDRNLVGKFYKKSLQSDGDENPPLFRLQLAMIRSEYIGYLKAQNADTKEERKVLEHAWEQLSSCILPERMQSLVEELGDAIKGDTAELYLQFAFKRNY